MFYPGFSKIRISKLYKFENVSALVDCYDSTLSGLLQEHAPLNKRVATIQPAAPWYDDQLRAEKVKRRRLERIWCKNKLTINREMFVKQCKCVNRLISVSTMKFNADINKDNSSNPRVLFFVHLCLWLQNEHEWQFCEEFAPHPGGTNDNDAHSCQTNYIKVQNKIIVKILPVNKFTTLKFLSLLRSMNG